MEEKVLISVIIPMYNNEKFINRCLNSIVNQTLKNIEIICVNDGSTDNTLKILREYQLNDNRIKIIDKSNGGVSEARNIGMRRAQGDYITFVDADDWLELNAFEKMYKFATKNNSDIIRSLYFNNNSKNDKINFYSSDMKKFEKDLILGRISGYVWVLLIKKDIFKENIDFDNDIAFKEDTIFYLKLLKHGYKIDMLNEYTYHYYENFDSASRNRNDYIKFLKNIIDSHIKIYKIEEGNVKYQKYEKDTFYTLLSTMLYRCYRYNVVQLRDLFDFIKEEQLINQKISKKINIKDYLTLKEMKKKDFSGLLKVLKIRLFLKNCKNIKTICINFDWLINSIKYKIGMRLFKKLYKINQKKFKYKYYSDEEVVENILKKQMSLARFGDGELKWMLGIKQQSFQDENKELASKLKECINSDVNNLMIGLPRALIDMEEYTEQAQNEWKKFIYFYGKLVNKNVKNTRKFANTNITRFYIDYKNKDNCYKRIELLKKIWEEKELLIIEGEKTKLGVGNDLFDNAKSKIRIIAPAKNAYDKIEDIKIKAEKYGKDKMILLALGPTATVLAYELAEEGYQAIDIGHIDIEYEWMKQKAKQKIPIKGKFVNEAIGKKDLSSEQLSNIEDYKREIIEKIL